MEILKELLRTDTLIGEVMQYPLSFIDLVAIVSGVLSVFFAVKQNNFTWTIGFVNEFAFAIIFYQVQLYAEMILQIIFALITCYGWVCWRPCYSTNQELSLLSPRKRIVVLGLIAIATLLSTLLISQIHHIAPKIFPLDSAYPLQDCLISAMAIAATILLAKKVIECWVLWILVDLASIYLCMLRNIPFMAMLHLLFLVMAIAGLRRWTYEFIGHAKVRNLIME